jgi:hypothetical protein
VCLLNIAALSSRMTANIAAGRTTLALSNARWRAGFHELLYGISSLAVEIADDYSPGAQLSIRHSPAYATYERENARLHESLRATWPEDDASIFARDLDDPQRYVFFSEFVNLSDERVWMSRLSRVRIPGLAASPGETTAELYERTVCSGEIDAMVNALETTAETDLLSFRAVHQVSEITAYCVNLHLCGAVEAMTSPEPEQAEHALRVLVISNRMLSLVDDAIKLMMRCLTPRAYREIRPNLGMVRGTSSVVLRKTLFNSTYPIFVHTYRMRITGFPTAVGNDDEAVEASAATILSSGDSESRTLAAIMRQLIVFHQHVRTWRDNHQQLPKTHLGVSPFPAQPTVSLSGSASAVEMAHALRKTHAADPILPLYRAALGTDPPDVHELLPAGGFEEHLAHATARAALGVYADVQERFYERQLKKSRS